MGVLNKTLVLCYIQWVLYLCFLFLVVDLPFEKWALGMGNSPEFALRVSCPPPTLSVMDWGKMCNKSPPGGWDPSLILFPWTVYLYSARETDFIVRCSPDLSRLTLTLMPLMSLAYGPLLPCLFFFFLKGSTELV